ncbi:hormone receptor 4-like [Babylonia areolata]|uniref:hormone receptor 4-like n=1 Tax=Babylonia areolata TaxID=304850 RepID=UPI003FD678C4
MADCTTVEQSFNTMMTELSQQQTVGGTSLFQDLKLKRKRVRDLLADSEYARSLYLEGPEADQRSDVSVTDSAYISDRGSECGTVAFGEEFPTSETQCKDGVARTILRTAEEKEALRFPTRVGETSDVPSAGSMPAGAMAYMQGYLMPVPAHLSHLSNMAPNGLRFIPLMGLPPHMFAASAAAAAVSLNGMSGPMFIPTPHSGYLLNGIQNSSGTVVNYHQPALNSLTPAAGTRQNSVLQQVNPESKEPSQNEDRVEKDQEFIRHYTSGTFPYTGHLVENPHNRWPPASSSDSGQQHVQEESDGEEALVCAICCDRATGLHYGIITCEGCKGFFKRTVQNKRVYTCVADGDCEINKQQRNRCQYCRFRKCLQMGMVMAAVREDRMPGGRNSDAIYSHYKYKVKYRKHKRKQVTMKPQKQLVRKHSPLGLHPPTSYYSPSDFNKPFLISSTIPPQLPPFSQFHAPVSSGGGGGSNTGNLTFVSPQSDSFSSADSAIEVDSGDNLHGSSSPHSQSTPLRGQGEAGQVVVPATYPLSSGTDTDPTTHTPPEHASAPGTSPPVSYAALMTELAREDSLLNIAEDYKIEQFAGSERSVAEAMHKVGNDIMLRLVRWMRQLPFHTDIPFSLQTQILSARWHHLLLLIMTAYGSVRGCGVGGGSQRLGEKSLAVVSCREMYGQHMGRLHQHLNRMWERGRVTLEQLHREVGGVMERVSRVMATFRRLGLTRKELAALQVLLLLYSEEPQTEPVLQQIMHVYQEALRHHILERFPSEANRIGDLLTQLSEICVVSRYLLHSKLAFVPFLLNS